MIGFCPLASGSKGNSIYLGTPKCKVLIDAGLSGKATKERLAAIDVDIAEINAIIVTHEHTDHIRGVGVLAKRYAIPIFANHGTARGISGAFDVTPKMKIFSTGESFVYEDMEFHPFSIQHDTLDPVAFTVRVDGLKLGFCTDLGFVTSLVRTHLQDCDYLYLEANHEPSMVHASPRPMVYKQRVLGRSGHLSNSACGQLLAEVLNEKIKHVHLAHLSEECNNPMTALEVVRQALPSSAEDLEISIAHQRQVSRAIAF